MITLATEGKVINTAPIARLITEGEKNADIIRVELPTSYGTLDLTALSWVLAGVSDKETRIEQQLVKSTKNGLTLDWSISDGWAAVPGRMRLELSGISADGNTVIKFTGQPIEVKPTIEAFGLPRPELAEQYLQTMRGLANQAQEAANALADAGLKILGFYDTLAALRAAVTAPAIGDLYGVGVSPSIYAYVWNGAQWAKGQSLDAVGGSNSNLLDNWYFPEPVNQRGKTSYTSGGYCVDRWFLSSGNLSLTLNSGSARLTKTATTGYQIMAQEIDPSLANYMIGKRVTLSVLSTEGNDSTTYTVSSSAGFDLTSMRIGTTNFVFNLMKSASTGKMSFRIFANGASKVGDYVDLIAAKLEFGAVQTLAHRENGTWVLNDPPPDYGQELAKCQRYQQVISATASFRSSFYQPNFIAFTIPCPVTLRCTPALVNSEAMVVRTLPGGIQSGFSFTVANFGSGYLRINASKTGHGLTDAELTNTGNIILDANL